MSFLHSTPTNLAYGSRRLDIEIGKATVTNLVRLCLAIIINWLISYDILFFFSNKLTVQISTTAYRPVEHSRFSPFVYTVRTL